MKKERKKERKKVEVFQVVVSVFSIIGVLAALIVVPEFRRWIGLDPEGTETAEIQDDKLAVFYDDDGSLDGTAALLYLLAHPDVAVQAITISYGEAHPAVYVQHIGRLLDDLGLSSIPLGAGQDRPLSDGNAFPDWIRQSSDDFWGISLPNEDRSYLATSAAELMVTSINQSDVPVTVFLSGPSTNLAQALRLDPGISESIDAVYIMGGALYVPGNIGNLVPDSPNSVAEWNFYADPQAAKEVLDSGLDIYLVPLDATDYVTINIEDTRLWRVGDKMAGYAASLYDISFNEYGMEVTEIWDLLVAVIMVDPELCGFQSLSVDVITEEGDTIGQTVLVANGQPNVSVCLYPDPDLVRQRMIDVFSHSE
jgi:inosine-uridine nucleoside N-ribohydrolase